MNGNKPEGTLEHGEWQTRPKVKRCSKVTNAYLCLICNHHIIATPHSDHSKHIVLIILCGRCLGRTCSVWACIFTCHASLALYSIIVRLFDQIFADKCLAIRILLLQIGSMLDHTPPAEHTLDFAPPTSRNPPLQIAIVFVYTWPKRENVEFSYILHNWCSCYCLTFCCCFTSSIVFAILSVSQSLDQWAQSGTGSQAL